MKKVVSIIFWVFIPMGMYCQTGFEDYYITDTDTVVGVKILDYGNKSNCHSFYVEEENGKVQFFPDKVKEYGCGSNRVYLSKILYIDNTVKRVFIEKLTDGKMSVYYYRGKSDLFIVEKDSSVFVAVPKKEDNKKSTYKLRLKEITDDCPDVADVANFIGYNKKSFTQFAQWYERCESRPYPHFRFGIRAGYGLYHLLDPPPSLKQFHIQYGGTFSLGLFMDAPVKMSNFSVNMGINYARYGYSYHHPANNMDDDFVANLSSFTAPVLVRYSFPSNTYRFFVQSGGIVEYNFNKDAYLYETYINGNIINISRKEAFIIDDVRFGFSIGAGAEYRVTTRNFLFLEISLHQKYGNMKNSDILFTIGLNI